MNGTRLVSELVAEGALVIEDGNHGEYRPRPHEFVDDGTPFIRAADMTTGVVTFATAGRIDPTARARIRKGVGQPGDALLSHKGTVGKVAVAPMDSPDFVCSPQTTFWRSTDPARIEQRYLPYVLKSPWFRAQLNYLMGQTDMAPYVSLTDQRAMSIPVPPIEVQRGIAEALGALDDKIAANTHLGRTGWALARAGFTQLQQGVTQDVAVGEILTLEYGKSLPASARMPGDVAVFGSGGSVGVHDTALVNRPGIVIGRKGSAGSVHWASGPHFPIDTTFFAVPAAADVPLTFCYFALASLRLDEMNSDSAVPGLNRGAAHAARVRLPEAEARMAFDAMATPLFALATQAERESTHLAKLRDALLPQLMSGKIRVKDAERVVEGVV